MPDTGWTPTPLTDKTLEEVTMEEWVAQALGAASACWENLWDAGVFDSTRAVAIYRSLMEHINGAIDEAVRDAYLSKRET